MSESLMFTACPGSEDGKHEFRFGYACAEPKKVGQPDAKAVYHCIHCLGEECKPMRGLLIPAVQVQLVQQQPQPHRGPSGLFGPGGFPEGM